MGKFVHGMAGRKYKHPLYGVWNAMKMRCRNPKNSHYRFYGGRGIEVCDRWWNSFEAFIHDMGERPPGASIDRIDVNGNYEPGNCRWATTKQQSRNTRASAFLTIDGVTKTQADWAEEVGISQGVLHSRLKNGWEPKDAVFKPLDKEHLGLKLGRGLPKRLITIGSETKSLADWLRTTGISESGFYARVNEKGWSVRRALFTPSKRRSLRGKPT